jgi:hypothetical protein
VLLVEAAVVVCMILALVVWMGGNASTRRSRRDQAVDVLLRKLARRLGGRVAAPADGEAQLHMEICGAPAVIRSEPGREHCRTVLRVDLSCICGGAVALGELVRWWRRYARTGKQPHPLRLPTWLRHVLSRDLAERLFALRYHRHANVPLAADGDELRIAVGRVATEGRILGRVEFAEALTALFLELASAVPNRPVGVYRS